MSTSTGTTIEQTIDDSYTTILARTGPAAEIQGWVSVVDSGALTLAQRDADPGRGAGGHRPVSRDRAARRNSGDELPGRRRPGNGGL
jgi:hypothetical protein